MTIDGTNTKAWGMVPVHVQGAYDMPNRKPPYFYDWGDTKDILLGPTYKAWEPRQIRVRFMYDSRQRTLPPLGANQVDAFIQQYAEAADLTLVTSDAEGTIGQATVKVQEVVEHVKYAGGVERFTMVFRERVPAFNGVVPGTKSVGSVSIDGYGLGQFSAKIIKVRGLSNLPSAKQSRRTTYLEATDLQAYRNLGVFTMSLVIRDNNPYTKLASLQQVLAGEAVLPFVYPGYSFDCICGQGFIVTKLDDKTLKFDLKLIRL